MTKSNTWVFSSNNQTKFLFFLPIRQQLEELSLVPGLARVSLRNAKKSSLRNAKKKSLWNADAEEHVASRSNVKSDTQKRVKR